MDGATQELLANLSLSIIPGVVSNAVYAMMTKLGSHYSHKPVSELIAAIKSQADLPQILQDNFKPEFERIQLDPAPLKQFLNSPETDFIIAQLFTTKINNSELSKVEEVRKEFCLAFAFYLDIPILDAEAVATPLFDSILVAVNVLLDAQIIKGLLPAHESKSALRHWLITSQLNSIERNLLLLSSVTSATFKDYISFEQKYRMQVAQRHRTIALPSLAGVKRTEIERIYVSNSFSIFQQKKAEGHFERRFSAEEILSRLDRTVILRDPGAGKSTFANFVCFATARERDSKIVAGRSYVPILITLRDFGAAKKLRPLSILQFIEETAVSKYQVSIVEGAFEYLLSNGRALVIFDGLDELLDTSYRREVSQDVESFSSLYPSTPILVTSRKIGYDQAPLDAKMFDALKIAEFDSSQVQTYVRKFFSLDDELQPKQQGELASGFLLESRGVEDLRSNPLILGLMCSIYRGNGYIPQNRLGRIPEHQRTVHLRR